MSRPLNFISLWILFCRGGVRLIYCKFYTTDVGSNTNLDALIILCRMWRLKSFCFGVCLEFCGRIIQAASFCELDHSCKEISGNHPMSKSKYSEYCEIRYSKIEYYARARKYI